MDWTLEKEEEIAAGIWAYYQPRLDVDPKKTLRDVEQELYFQDVRYGNNWTGRGVVMDLQISVTIHTLEAVRAACITRMNVATLPSPTGRLESDA